MRQLRPEDLKIARLIVSDLNKEGVFFTSTEDVHRVKRQLQANPDVERARKKRMEKLEADAKRARLTILAQQAKKLKMIDDEVRRSLDELTEKYGVEVLYEKGLFDYKRVMYVEQGAEQKITLNGLLKSGAPTEFIRELRSLSMGSITAHKGEDVYRVLTPLKKAVGYLSGALWGFLGVSFVSLVFSGLEVDTFLSLFKIFDKTIMWSFLAMSLLKGLDLLLRTKFLGGLIMGFDDVWEGTKRYFGVRKGSQRPSVELQMAYFLRAC